MKFLVVSDLHCHDHRSAHDNESYYRAGAPRVPVNKDPLQALLHLIRTENITCDAVLCPGDLSNKANNIGLAHAWYGLNELKAELKAKNLVVALGNHDVDSRRSNHDDPFELARTIHPDFPFFCPDLKESYLNRGFAHIETESVSFLVINSVIDHHNEGQAKRGNFPEERLAQLKLFLKEKREPELGVVVVHHHPHLHSGVNMDSGDVLQTGDQLLEIASEYNYRLVIHGHRHMPRMAKAFYSGNPVHIFGAGSFSKMLEEMQTETRNVAHFVELEEGTYLKGGVKTFEYSLSAGWQRSTHQSSSLPYRIGFTDEGIEIDDVAKSIGNIVGEKEFMKGNVLLDAEQRMLYMAFEEMKALAQKLESEYKIRAMFSGDGSFQGVYKL